MRVAIYTRKSVYRENSESIETQIKLCKNYFNGKNEYEIFEDEGFSGKNTNRPAFKRMIALCKMKKFDAVVVYKIDRIARNMVDFVNIYDILSKHEINLVSITEQFDTSSPMGRAMMFMLAIFADMERENIRQRVKDNMLELAKKGCWTGGTTPKGYALTKIDGKSYLKLEDEEFIKDMFTWYTENRSAWEVHKLQKEKYKNKAYAASRSLLGALRSPNYVQSSKEVSNYFKNKGYKIYGKENGKGYLVYAAKTEERCLIVSEHEAVISAELWLKANIKLDKTKEEYFKKPSKTYWLTGTLKCPYCGSHYVLVNNNNKTYYVCKNRLKKYREKGGKCNNSKYVLAEEIESKIKNQLFPKLLDDKYFNDTFNSISDNSKIDIKSIEKKIKINENQINSLVEKMSLLSNDASKFLIDKIEELTKENSEFKMQIEECKIKEIQDTASKNNKEIVKSNIDLLNKTVDAKTLRRITQLTFKHLIYDPVEDTLKVEF
jgi:DNA invertase Pin-like site-specific DNA recombinase